MSIYDKTVTLTQKNVEDLIFYNRELRSKLPNFLEVFQTWDLGTRIPVLRPSAQKAILDFLNSVSEKDISIIEEYFDTHIVIEKLDYALIRNYNIDISDVENRLNNDIEKYANFFIYRKDKQLYISFWR